MANTSEEFLNFTLSPLTPEDCSNEKYFGFIFLNLIMALCFLVGTPARLWCLWFYFRTKEKIKDTQVFFLNHIVMEIIYSIECGMEILNRYIINDGILWYVIYFWFGLSWSGRPLFQICICVERYLAVIHPVTFLKIKGMKYRIAAAVAAWLIAFAYGIYEIYVIKFDYIYTFVFILALSVMSFCGVSVLCALKHSGPGDTHVAKTGRDRGNQQKRKAIKIILSALLLVLFTYLPQALLMILTGAGVHTLLFQCNITPIMSSLNILPLIIMPLLELYKKSNHKAIKHPGKIK